MLVGGVPANPVKPLSEKAKGSLKAEKEMYEKLAQKYISLDLG
jgi:carbonic anhydrase/acetyltransferase-like protein (isoleucine patch superfamily)